MKTLIAIAKVAIGVGIVSQLVAWMIVFNFVQYLWRHSS